MFKDLMHNLLGSSTGHAALTNSVLQGQQARRSVSKKIFSGNIEVQQVSNGYVVNIATKEGYEYETHIAQTITEVNEIIAAAMVAFQLEK
jgi:hypothetical protein